MDKHQILIVEDDAMAGEDLRFQLERLGYGIPAIEPSAARALKAVEKYQPDLVLMDIFLEGDMDGIETAAQINERWGIPIVFMSIYSDRDVLERAKLTQPFGYIVKPHTERELQAVLSMALFRAEAEKKIHASDWMLDSLDTMGIALIHTDQQGRISAMNNFAVALLRAPFEKLHGQWLPDQMELLDDQGERPLNGSLSDVLNGNLSRVRIRNLTLQHENEDRQSVDLTVSASDAGCAIPGADVLLQLNNSTALPARSVLASGHTGKPAATIKTSPEMRTPSKVDNYVAMISHDVRAPLADLGRLVQALDRNLTPGSRGHVQDYLDHSYDSIKRLQNFIQNLVIYMRLGRGRLPVDAVDLDQVVTDCMEELLPAAPNLNSQLRVDRPLPVVRAHAATLMRLLTQVLANALRFVAPDAPPRVHVWAQSTNNRIRLCIDDRCQAIPAAQRESVFGLLQRNPYPHSPAGAGIGLAIARRAAAWMGGRTGIEENPDGGNRFWLELPAA